VTSIQPRVTIIIPVYNGERYLAAAMDSVIAQTHPPAEIIVIDDGSTDHSAELATAYAPAVCCLRQPHHGPAAARNAGVAAATSDWIAFLDADDLWRPDKLALQVTALSAPDVDAVLGAYHHFFSPDLDAVAQARLVCPSGLMTSPTAGALLVRRSIFPTVGGFDETLLLGEFIDWWLRAMDWGMKSVMLPELVMERRIHGNNTTLRLGTEHRAYVQLARKRITLAHRRSL
jgi:glycosyltransferase involved in cell wall biosynthesis